MVILLVKEERGLRERKQTIIYGQNVRRNLNVQYFRFCQSRGKLLLFRDVVLVGDLLRERLSQNVLVLLAIRVVAQTGLGNGDGGVFIGFGYDVWLE